MRIYKRKASQREAEINLLKVIDGELEEDLRFIYKNMQIMIKKLNKEESK